MASKVKATRSRTVSSMTLFTGYGLHKDCENISHDELVQPFSVYTLPELSARDMVSLRSTCRYKQSQQASLAILPVLACKQRQLQCCE